MGSPVQVILKQSVNGLGRAGDLVRVRAGFARNYLIPRDIAMVATRGNVSQIEHEKRLALAREEKLQAEQKTIAQKLETIVLMIAKPAGEEGKLYGSVTAADIIEALEQKEVSLDKKKLLMPKEAIKAVGSYEIGVKLEHGVQAKFKLEVKTAA